MNSAIYFLDLFLCKLRICCISEFQLYEHTNWVERLSSPLEIILFPFPFLPIFPTRFFLFSLSYLFSLDKLSFQYVFHRKFSACKIIRPLWWKRKLKLTFVWIIRLKSCVASTCYRAHYELNSAARCVGGNSNAAGVGAGNYRIFYISGFIYLNILKFC